MTTKQVIVIRKDLNMRKGKMVAQGCHASMSFITKGCELRSIGRIGGGGYGAQYEDPVIEPYYWPDEFIHEVQHWLTNSFKKVCVYVNSEEELENLHQKVLEAGLISHLITDNGATEFGGVPTKTCLAIGPHFEDKFEGLTDHLPLL